MFAFNFDLVASFFFCWCSFSAVTEKERKKESKRDYGMGCCEGKKKRVYKRGNEKKKNKTIMVLFHL